MQGNCRNSLEQCYQLSNECKNNVSGPIWRNECKRICEVCIPNKLVRKLPPAPQTMLTTTTTTKPQLVCKDRIDTCNSFCRTPRGRDLAY
ncbi:hypothetical protein L596_029201 [Steinernema carpocapsae]|uniref:ShKT domain-containing protein n=1 Tax=Steinernema carpocapsae TaxID=34508 RepID=A0A4U5LTY0_STECR|nr:hypothetical protein L596_029201 [Steinernema carpocapsae]